MYALIVAIVPLAPRFHCAHQRLNRALRINGTYGESFRLSGG